MTDITTLGIAVDTRPLNEANKELVKLVDNGDKASAAAKKTGDSFTSSAKVTKGATAQMVAELEKLNATQARQEAMLSTLEGGFAGVVAAIGRSTQAQGAQAQAAQAASAALGVEAQVTAALTTATNSMSASMAAVVTAMRAEQRAADEAARAKQVSTQATRQQITAQDSHVQAFRAQAAAVDKYLQSLREEVQLHGASRQAIESHKAAQMGLTNEQRAAAAALGGQIDQLKAAQGATGGLQAALGVLGGAMATVFAVKRVADFSKALFDASASAERITTTLSFASGGNGAQEFKYVSKFADDLGLSIKGTAQAYASLTAASRGTTLEGEGARRVFESVSKASAVMGLSADQSSGALLALQQIVSKGTVQAEELRGQLGERLPGAFQTAARAMGVTTAELGKMLEQGLVPASEFLPKFAAQLEKELGDAALTASNRLDAATNRFDNAWDRLKRAAGDAGVAKAYGGTLDRIAGGFNTLSASIEGMTASKSFGDWLLAGMQSLKTVEADLKIAQQQLAAADAQLAKAPSNIYFRSAAADAQAYVNTLLDARRRLTELQGGATIQGGGGGRGSVNPPTIRQMDENAAAIKAYTENAKNLTKEGQKQKEIQDAITENAKLQGRAMGDRVQLAALEAALTQRKANIEEKYRDKKAGAGLAAAARDEINSEAEAQKKAFAVTEAQAKRYIDNLTAQRKAGALTEIEYIEMVATEEQSLLQLEERSLQGQMTAIGKKKNSLKELAVLQGQLSVNREKQITREQKLENDLAEAIRNRVEASRVLHNNAITASTQELAAMVERNKQSELEIGAIGLNSRRLQELTNARMLDTEAKQQDKIASMQVMSQKQEDIDAIDIEVRKLEELRVARQLYNQRADTTRTVEKEQREWSELYQSIDSAGRETFQTLGDRGVGTMERIGKSVKSAIMGALYELTVKKWIVNVGAAIFGDGFANAAGLGTSGSSGSGISGLLGLANNAKSVYQGYNTLAGWFGGGTAAAASTSALGLSATTGAGVIGAGIGSSVGLGTAATTAGTGLGLGGTLSGGVLTSTGGLGLTAGSAGAGAIGGTLGTSAAVTGGTTAAAGAAGAGGVTSALAAIPGWGWAAIAAIAVVSLLAKKGEQRYGGGYNITADGLGVTDGVGAATTGLDGTIKSSILGTFNNINSTLRDLGSTSQVLTSFQAGLETSEKGRGGNFAGGQLNSGEMFGTVYAQATYNKTQNLEEAYAAFQRDLSVAYVDALKQAGDVPASIKKIIAAAESSTGKSVKEFTQEQTTAVIEAIQKQITAVADFRKVVSAMGIDTLSEQSYAYISNLADMAGGFDTLSAQMGTYYDKFFTSQEKLDNLTKTLGARFEAIGYTLPKTNAEFKALVQTSIALGEAGGKTLSALLGMVDSFGTYMDLQDEVSGGTNNLTTAYEKQKTVVQELATKVSNLFSARNSAGALADRIGGALGYGGNGFAAQRESEMWTALSRGNAQQQLDIASQLTDIVLARQQNEIQNAKALLEYSKSLKQYVDGLKVGELSPLTPSARLAEAQQQYRDTLEKARGGDETAKGNLTNSASAYLSLAREYFASNEQYTRIFDSVTAAIDGLATTAAQQAAGADNGSPQSVAELQKLYAVTQQAYKSLDAQYDVALQQLDRDGTALAVQADQLGKISEVADLIRALPSEISVAIRDQSEEKDKKAQEKNTENFVALAGVLVDALDRNAQTVAGAVTQQGYQTSIKPVTQ